MTITSAPASSAEHQGAAPVPPTPAPEPAPAAARAPWRSLRHRGMRWWSAANLVSNAGTWMQLTVQNLLVLQLTHSAAMTGLSLAIQVAPGLLLGLAGGAAVDRWPRKLTAGVGQALLGVVAFTTAVLVACGLLTIPVLLALALVSGLIATVDGPACALLGNDLVPREDVPSAIAVGSVVSSVGRLAGTALAGLLMSLLGPASAYAANGLSFLCVAAVIPFLRLNPAEPPPPAAVTEPARGGRALYEGLAFFCRRRRLLALAALTALGSVLGRNYGLTLAALVTGPLHAGPGGYGLVSSVLAIGGTAGAVLAGRLRRPSVRLVAVVTAAGGLLQAVAALSPTMLPLVLAVVPMAVLESAGDTAVTTLLQTDPPAHLRGRVLGTWRSLSTAWGLAGPPLLGLLIQTLGARGALVGGGLVTAGAVAAGALVPALRRSAPIPQLACASA
ncbi:MFS transporter [Kitasatospora humi]|uniref:MFS transporter n=1 Tax=Kitasatospora humi TaxID=2893891 RepID=UPI00201C4A02